MVSGASATNRIKAPDKTGAGALNPPKNVSDKKITATTDCSNSVAAKLLAQPANIDLYGI